MWIDRNENFKKQLEIKIEKAEKLARLVCRLGSGSTGIGVGH